MTTIPRDARSGIPTVYGGVTFRSVLESRWARLLDRYGVPWRYESRTFKWADRWYLPDMLVDVPLAGGTSQTWIGIKPYADHELIGSFGSELWIPGDRVVAETGLQFLVLFGFPGGRQPWSWTAPWNPPDSCFVPWITAESVSCEQLVVHLTESGDSGALDRTERCGGRCVECAGRIIRREERRGWATGSALARLREHESLRQEAERTAGVYKIGNVTIASRAWREKHGR